MNHLLSKHIMNGLTAPLKVSNIFNESLIMRETGSREVLLISRRSRL